MTAEIKTLGENPFEKPIWVVGQLTRRQNLVLTITPSLMPPLTLRKQSRKATAKDNTSQPSESPKRLSNKNKRVHKPTSKENRHSKTNYVPHDEEDEEDDELEPVAVKDISQETYTLHKSVMICETVVVGDTDFLKHEEFDYRQFEMHNIRKLDDAAKKGGYEFEFTSGTATISAKGVRVMDNIVIVVEDNHSWKKVEKGIERWMLANKKEIIVKLSVVYMKTSEPVSDSSDDEQPTRKKVVALFCC